jgi:hypothetical protein
VRALLTNAPPRSATFYAARFEALRWLRRANDATDWGAVWYVSFLKSVRNHKLKSELLDLAERWLEEHETSQYWLPIAKRLVLNGRGKAQLELWLRTRTDSPRWQAVWLAATPVLGDATTTEVAREFLRSSPEHPMWAAVMAKTAALNEDDMELYEIALEWLLRWEAYSRWERALPSFFQIWKTEELHELAWQGLFRRGNIRKWSRQWVALLRQAPAARELREDAVTWLGANAETEAWPTVFAAICGQDGVPSSIDRTARDWLETHQESYAWPFAWRTAVRSGARDWQFDLAVEWLKTHNKRSTAIVVHSTLKRVWSERTAV